MSVPGSFRTFWGSFWDVEGSFNGIGSRFECHEAVFRVGGIFLVPEAVCGLHISGTRATLHISRQYICLKIIFVLFPI